MRAQEFVTESIEPTFNTARRRLNVPELIRRGAIFITHPHGPYGWETEQPTWDFSLITLQNVLEKSPPWSVEYKKYLRPESYQEAIGNQQFWIGLGDEKYRQILWSIKKLGIPDEVAFLDGQLDEGWKEKLGAAALAGSMALGGSAQASPMGNAVSMAISSVVDKNRNASDEEFAKQIPDENDRETYLKAFKRVKRLRALAYSDSTVAGALKVREQQLKKLKKEIAEKYNIPMPVKEQGVAEGQFDSLIKSDQAERNAYKKFVADRAGGDWKKGARLYAKLKNRPADDIFGDDARLQQFMRIKFDFANFTKQDWRDFWLLSQHADTYPDFQQQALDAIQKHLGQDNDYYRYLADRISCARTGQQKYGTQDICDQQGAMARAQQLAPRGTKI